jgi:hypothetical protein
MAALVSALDKMNNIQYGENNHIEYKWSEIQQEQILQLSFQLVRTTDVDKRHELAKKFTNCFKKGSLDERKILIKLLAHTRDIEEGKGEYALSIAIISELAEIEAYREICAALMCIFVGASTSNVNSEKPMGSWKDMKYLFNELDACPPELVTVINKQLKEDIESVNNTKSCSLLAKWIPREKSKKFGWIHKILAMDYFEHYGHLGWTKRATDKAQTYYRKIVSRLNRYIDTVQIKQCSHTWKSINFDNVTSITMMKQRKAFLNEKSLHDNDRIICRQHLLQHIEQVKNGTKEMKGKRTSMIDFVKAAIELKDTTNNNTNNNTNTNSNNNTNTNSNNNTNTNSNRESERFIINEAWKNNSKDTKSLENMIAMVDTSGSMESENSQPLYSAIGLGIRVAEKSKLGKRIMTFDANPTWINLDNCKDFVDEVHTVKDAGWGMNTNFHKAMELILNQIKVNKLAADDVENLVLVVFSDMQFDAAEKNDEFNRPSHINGSICGGSYTRNSCGPNDSSCGSQHHVQATETQTIRQILVKKFHDAGVEICGKGYKMPHILFWNLRSTNGFPELSYQNNVTMLSGYSPMLLNSFMEDGMTGLRDATPWGMLTKMLDKERYNVLESLVK